MKYKRPSDSKPLNLLPWREQNQRRHQWLFGWQLGNSLLLISLILYASSCILKQHISPLQQQIVELRQKIVKLQDAHAVSQLNDYQQNMALLQQKQKTQIAMHTLLQSLQSLAIALTPELTITTLNQQGTQLILEGQTTNASAVNQLIAQLSQSPLFAHVVLTTLEAGNPTVTNPHSPSATPLNFTVHAILASTTL